jgi:protein gp37
MKDTKISWCDHTLNGWIGCTKVSPGCANCYAETMMDKRWGKVKWGAGNPRQRTSAANWKQPLKWNKEAGELAIYDPAYRPRVFCGSLCDWLDDEVPIEWLADLLNLIRLTPNLDWLLLTKRPQNFMPRIKSVLEGFHQNPDLQLVCSILNWACSKIPWSNVWIGTTVEDQQRADERIPLLLDIPAKVRFLSCEPLLGEVDLVNLEDFNILCNEGIHWIICGGESGPKARPMRLEWARSLREQCELSGVPFFFKQWDGTRNDILDGVQHHEFPKP